METRKSQPIRTIAVGGGEIAHKILQEIRQPTMGGPLRKPRTFQSAGDGLWRGWVKCDGGRRVLELRQTFSGNGEGVLLLCGVPGRNRSVAAVRDKNNCLVLELGNELTATDIRRLANQIVADAITGRIRIKQPQKVVHRPATRRRPRIDPWDRWRGIGGWYS